jgi:serine/tyrosine/threonine adenylyltransferase
MPVSARYRSRPVLEDLGDGGFFATVEPAPFPRCVLRFRNRHWSERVGLGDLSDAEWLDHFCRFRPLPGNLRRPLALAYHGHQFRAYNPELGDGRGFVFAQLVDPGDGRLLDLGTKGSGTTPWSRGLDGRLTLKGAVREALAAEMLEALGVYTSKVFSVVETGEHLYRSDEPSPTRSAVLVRLSHGHLRFGSFQRLAHRGDRAGLKRLLDFALEHYLPDLDVGGGNAPSTPSVFLREVARRTADLVAAWMAAGFVHGVLNTDNMSITGESFDYGPYRFLPTYDPGFVAAYFDHTGLYAYGRQPSAVLWNLAQLARALAPLCPAEELRPALDQFASIFAHRLDARVVARLGLASRGEEADATLVLACYDFLRGSRIGYERFFFDWYGGAASEERALAGPAAPSYRGDAFRPVRERLAAYAPAHPERLSAPYFAGDAPCTLLHEEAEAIWAAIAERDDWAPFALKIGAMREAFTGGVRS